MNKTDTDPVINIEQRRQQEASKQRCIRMLLKEATSAQERIRTGSHVGFVVREDLKEKLQENLGEEVQMRETAGAKALR